MRITEIVLIAVSGYLLVGIAFGVWWVFAGAGRSDALAARTPIRVRLLFLPGAAMLWPVLITKGKQALATSVKGGA